MHASYASDKDIAKTVILMDAPMYNDRFTNLRQIVIQYSTFLVNSTSGRPFLGDNVKFTICKTKWGGKASNVAGGRLRALLLDSDPGNGGKGGGSDSEAM